MERYDRDVGTGERRDIRGILNGDEDHAVDSSLDERRDVRPLSLAVEASIADDEQIAARRSRVLEGTGELPKEPVGNVGDEQADRCCAALAECAC